jgi:hypothetical protein
VLCLVVSPVDYVSTIHASTRFTPHRRGQEALATAAAGGEGLVGEENGVVDEAAAPGSVTARGKKVCAALRERHPHPQPQPHPQGKIMVVVVNS